MELIQGNNQSYEYGVASRNIEVHDDLCFWAVNFVVEGYVAAHGNGLLGSNYEGDCFLLLRPVITLSSNVTTSEVSKVLSAQSES